MIKGSYLFTEMQLAYSKTPADVDIHILLNLTIE